MIKLALLMALVSFGVPALVYGFHVWAGMVP
jgi:hypothetical protein